MAREGGAGARGGVQSNAPHEGFGLQKSKLKEMLTYHLGSTSGVPGGVLSS